MAERLRSTRRVWLAGLLAVLFVRAAFALPAFDFTDPDASPKWATHDLGPISRTPEGLVLPLAGRDPYVVMESADFSTTNPIFLRLRMRSEAGGEGQLFWFHANASERDSLHFEVSAGEWIDVAIPLPPLGPGWRLRLDPPGESGQCVIAMARVEEVGTAGITKVSANATEMVLTMNGTAEPLRIVELAPFQTMLDAAKAPTLAEVAPGGISSVRLPRWDGERDRLYSGFAAMREHPRLGAVVAGTIRFVEEFNEIAKVNDPFPNPGTKKGLQVQMLDDALALGVKHAALNVNLAALIDLVPQPDSIAWKMDGQTYYFRRSCVESLPVKACTDAGVLVYLILFYIDGPPELGKIMRHPRDDRTSPHHFSAFNTANADGLRYFKVCLEFLTDYFSQPDAAHGRVWGWIIGNEVNAHNEWYNCGPRRAAPMAEDYARTLRVAVTALRKSSATARVYISLEHHWTEVPANRELKQCGGRTLMENLARCGRLGGDFDWQIAHHPYPEDLFNPRVWLNTTATHDNETLKVTFKNLEVLQQFVRRPEILYHGSPRRVILSEQGFHCLDTPDGETLQAAAYCYAWEKVARLDAIDAFILHRHVDHAYEGGLNLGLWTHKPDTIFEPGRHRLMYDVFKAADTPRRADAFAFALPIIGIRSWDEVMK